MSARAPSTILCVDDTPDKLQVAAVMLRRAGYEVATATDGQTAFDIARQQIPDLILSDVAMPGMDGIELCRVLRADENLKTVPIILLTAQRKDTESVAQGLAAGADDYIEAPYDPPRLVAKVARFIERKQAEEPLARLASIVENSDDGIIGTTLNGIITSWNFGAQRMYGYGPAQMIGNSIFATLPADKCDELRGILNCVRKGLRVNNFQTRGLREDGTVIDVSITLSPIINVYGEVTGASAITRDITERILAEEEREHLIEELHEALAEVKTLQGILPICMYCRQVRDDKGAWESLEVYVQEHTDTNFSHGMCEPCSKKMYPEIFDRGREKPAKKT